MKREGEIGDMGVNLLLTASCSGVSYTRTHIHTGPAAWDFIPDFCSFPDTLCYDIGPLPASHPVKQEVRKLGVTESFYEGGEGTVIKTE